MRSSILAFVEPLFLTCVAAMAVAVPISCAQGSVEGSIASGPILAGNGGATQTVGHGGAQTGTATDVTVTSTGGASTTNGFPSAVSSTTTTSGFPSAVSSTTGFPSAVSSSSSTTTSSGGPSSPCDIGGPSDQNCSDCGCCAENDTCFDQTFECEDFDCDCANILSCVQFMGCTDNACIQDCANQYPAGLSDFNALIQCLDCSCVQTCSVPAGTCP